MNADIPTPPHLTLLPSALCGDLQAALDASPQPAWPRAWVLTALGRYGDALPLLDGAARSDDPALAARALATRASLFRQVGLHARAERDDGVGRERARAAGDVLAEAALLVGRVADAVGLGADAAERRRRLEDARGAVGESPGWRQRVRLAWVEGESALVDGDHVAAGRHFTAARDLARARSARRHVAKSVLFLAAARLAGGDVPGGRAFAEEGRAQALACGAAPLTWPAALLLADAAAAAGDGAGAARWRGVAAAELHPLLATLPDDLRREARARPPAVGLALPPARLRPPGRDSGAT